jgi:hypothetical protein
MKRVVPVAHRMCPVVVDPLFCINRLRPAKTDHLIVAN